MRIEINKGVIRRARLWLARLIAPSDAHLHVPYETCPCAQNLMDEILMSRLQPNHPRADRFGTGEFTRYWMDVTADVDELVGLGLVEGLDHGDVKLTEHGERELAKLWGPGRVPPWGGGYYSCHDHGQYEAGPGDRLDCPSCLMQEAVIRAVVGGAPRTPGWRLRWPSSRAPR